MRKLHTLFLTLTFFTGAAFATDLTMYKSPYCGCCTAWAEQVQEAGFNVIIVEQENNIALRKKHGITAELTSCHTAVVEGYALEGHVPVKDIKRLLRNKPVLAGLAVPGMPASSPGMDIPGNTDPYQVIAFDKEGNQHVFNQYHMK
ncbi:metal-binding protein [Psychromonas sp. psych-6C06]|uniref:DUF411 domain-containing protein n=1 Tax=Psychromonas sp. psych-6C06 TaxID=2058089 RepID=UPI000C3407BA|nr:DUF411 domain-containing protein [Psychromonas sp. psych-6C06]PKF62592.1 metal-binding protein [Psychromonas sp. psych-6C06]